jgi:hypothetical protein
MACRGQIPTVIISMRPAGYKLILNQDDLNFYDGEPIHEDWESYDERLAVYKTVILEHSLSSIKRFVRKRKSESC